MTVKQGIKGSSPTVVKHIKLKKVDWGKIITAVLITVISVTAWTHIKYRTNQAQVEKHLNSQIELKEQKLNELNKTNETTSKEAENLKKETEELKKQLQAKREKQAKDKVFAESLSNIQPPYHPSGTKAEWLIASGIPKDQWGYVDYLVSRESGWNPCAYNPGRSDCNANPTTACGLVQQYPCHKIPGDWRDPVVALKWQYNYVNARYGGYAQAVAYWKVHHNY